MKNTKTPIIEIRTPKANNAYFIVEVSQEAEVGTVRYRLASTDLAIFNRIKNDDVDKKLDFIKKKNKRYNFFGLPGEEHIQQKTSELRIFDNVSVDYDAGFFQEVHEPLTKADRVKQKKKLTECLNMPGMNKINGALTGANTLGSSLYSLWLLLIDKHPLYSLEVAFPEEFEKDRPLIIQGPIAEEIKALRSGRVDENGDNIGQQRMAELAGFSAVNPAPLMSQYESGLSKMGRYSWTIYLFAMDRHPYYSLVAKDSLPIVDSTTAESLETTH